MIETVPCTVAHLRELAASLRAEELAEIAAVNENPERLMIALWHSSPQPWAAVRDGKVIAAWGDSAPVLSREGHVWLFTSTAVEKIPLRLYREARSWVGRLLVPRETLRSSVGVKCERAIRFYRMLGFDIGEPIGPFREIRISRWAS